MAAFNWDKCYVTGLPSVDQQHQALVDLINRYGDLLTAGEQVSDGDLDAVLQELAGYADYHFAEEEKLMTQAGLDERHIQQHKHFHTEFLHEVGLMKASLEKRYDKAQQLLKFLTYWLAYHILGTDQSMARQMAAIAAGRDPRLAYVTDQDEQEGATEPLLRALNGLFDQVSQRNRELRELNSTLEAKVQERTQALLQANKMLEQIAMTDVLTGLPNRRQAMARLALAWSQSVQNSLPLACMMIDADGFKQVNDRHGHDAGDLVLCELARQLRQAVRTDDLVCRLGGDEFLIICPATTLAGALHAAHLVHQAVAQMRVSLSDGGVWVGSISVGVAAKTAAMGQPDDLIKRADDGLYLAKNAGRNQVQFDATDGPPALFQTR